MFYALKVGQPDVIESTKYDIIASAIKSEQSIGLDCETFYKDTVNYPTKGKNNEVDWKGLNPNTGEIQYIQIFLPSSNLTVALSIKALGYNYLTDNPIICELLKFLQDENKVTHIHNALYECLWFKSKFGIDIVNAHCTMLASQFNNAGLHYAINRVPEFRGPNKLGTVVKMILGFNIDKSEQTSNWSGTLTKEQIIYMLLDPFYAYHLGVHFKAKFSGNVAYDAEQGSIPCFSEMNFYGVPCDIQKMTDLLGQYNKIIDKLHNDLMAFSATIFKDYPEFKQTLIPKSYSKKKRENFQINLKSPTQLKPFINFVLKLNGHDEIENTTAATLEKISSDFAFGLLLKEFRTITKIRDYIIGFINSYDPVKKSVIGSFNILALQAIGRSSCRAPSLQIVSKDSPVLKKYGLRSPRVAFKSTDPNILFGILDFSASHMALAWAFSNDYTLTLAAKEGVKSHYYTLKAIFGLQGRHFEARDLERWHGEYKAALKKDNKENTDRHLKEYLSQFDSATAQVIVDTDNLYTVSKNAFYSFLNKASKFSLQTTFAKVGVHFTIDECQLFLTACKETYSDIWRFQNECVREAARSIDNEFFIPQFDPRLFTLVAPYGVTPANLRNLWIDKISRVVTKDGRLLRQSCVFAKTDEYWMDESGQIYYEHLAQTRPSQIVSNQWLSVEASIGKVLMRRLWDYFRKRPEVEFLLRCFAHDEIDSTCNSAYAEEVKEIKNRFAEEEFRKFSPYYVQESMAFVEDWSEK